MSWKERRSLRGGASFRRVPFYVDDVQSTQGRRTAVHRFPGRDDVAVQDLGRDTQTFKVNAYVIGPNYDAALAELEEALLEGGPGELVHPWRGRYTVVVTGPVQTRESKGDGGMASISFEVTVIEPESYWVFPVRPDLEAQVDIDAAALATAASEDFVSAAENLSPEAMRVALEELDSAIANLRRLDHGGDALQLAADIAAFSRASPALLRSPVEFAAAFAVIHQAAYMGLLSRADADRVLVSEAQRLLTEAGASMGPVARLDWALGAADLSRAIGSVPFASHSEATAARDAVSELLDAVAEEASDTTFEEISTLRASLVQHLGLVARGLPELATYSPPIELPALLVAHILYGDARREAEIIARNDPRNPGFLEPGPSLEVLSA